jgi:hypothetical protein
LILKSNVVLVMVSAESENDKRFKKTMSTLKEFGPFISNSINIAAVRVGEVDIPAAISSGFVAASWSQFQSHDGIDSVALAALRLIYRPPPDATPVEPEAAPTPPTRLSLVVPIATSAEVAFSALLGAALYTAVLVHRGQLSEAWWQPTLVIIALAVSRAAAGNLRPRWNASHDHASQTTSPTAASSDTSEPKGDSKPAADTHSSTDWVPKLAGVIGASAAIITGLVQAGSVASQHAIATHKDAEAHDRTVAAEQQAHEKQLVDRANNYLSFALANDSYDRRLTLLSFLKAVPGESKTSAGPEGRSESGFRYGLREWATLEATRLEKERNKLVDILEDLISDCERTKELCRPSGAHARSIVRITQQIGPENLGTDRARRIARFGIPIADISSADTTLVGTATRLNPTVKGGTPIITPGAPEE